MDSNFFPARPTIISVSFNIDLKNRNFEKKLHLPISLSLLDLTLFSATGDGIESGMDMREGGGCSTHNMKLAIAVEGKPLAQIIITRRLI